MTKVGQGYLRGQQQAKPATAAARKIKAASAGNVQVAPVPFDSDPELLRAMRSAVRLPSSSHGGLTQITSGPASSRPPRRTK